MPPPALHTRSTNDGYDRPSTPTQQAFTSPERTPQGSPSKNQLPPGAYDLPNVFENAMKLVPTAGSPSKAGRQQPSPNSPSKGTFAIAENRNDSAYDVAAPMPGSPTRKSNKENTPPGHRPQLNKESSYLNHAAASRQEPYRPREQAEPGEALGA